MPRSPPWANPPTSGKMDRIVSGLKQLIEDKKFATDAEVEQIISRVMG